MIEIEKGEVAVNLDVLVAIERVNGTQTKLYLQGNTLIVDISYPMVLSYAKSMRSQKSFESVHVP